MNKTEQWVVYRITVRGKATELSAVCEQGAWEAMEQAQPGYHTLIRAGIINEGEAERLARSGSMNTHVSRVTELKIPRRS